MSDNREKLKIISAVPLNSRSLRLEFSNGAVRLFDSHRLRGPRYIPLMNENYFTRPVIVDGDLGWEDLDVTCDAVYVYNRSVHYDENPDQVEYQPTKRDIMGERIATVLFPVMAIAGVIGVIWWFVNN